MIDVRVGVQNARDEASSAVLPVKGQGRGGRLFGDQRVEHENTGGSFDEGDVREVESAHLVDALDDLEEALLGDELRLTPQTRVHRIGGISRYEVVGVVVPNNRTAVVGDGVRCASADEAPPGILEVLRV